MLFTFLISSLNMMHSIYMYAYAYTEEINIYIHILDKNTSGDEC